MNDRENTRSIKLIDWRHVRLLDAQYICKWVSR